MAQKQSPLVRAGVSEETDVTDNTESLSRSVHSVLNLLAGAEPPEPKVCGIAEVDAAIEFHKGAFEPD